ncbi:hypothetical protein ACRE_042050 [Hapsidospora chrysogenum ATCC 11550]|uniref:Uncharacterized protein n=1 Tax=Hapsidospora chrysogenum (strain ATCC 11550 / CBS 779.69 / DSM 880 / IAM 14645 / JCM 23072 / IMI 49137) TaxID=857340 RepID=A0A086T6K7_HAPC1|nr:hypothetical protein ACRE_042050 [Hapsidospora chrysogenum ATCC 11550]
MGNICGKADSDHFSSPGRTARAASANKPGGKLKAQLAAQKKQTRNDTLNEVSRQGLQGKEPDYANPRNWD